MLRSQLFPVFYKRRMEFRLWASVRISSKSTIINNYLMTLRNCLSQREHQFLNRIYSLIDCQFYLILDED